MHNVIVFGEVLADIFPDVSVLGGAPFNVAYHLHAFKQHAILISRIGADPLANQCKSLMASIGMNQAGMQTDATLPTGQVTVSMTNNSHQFDIKNHQAYDFIDANAAAKVVSNNTPDLLYFGSLIQRNPVSKQALNALLQASDCQRFVDINLREPWYDKTTIAYTLTQAETVKLSGEELQVIATLFAIERDIILETVPIIMQQFSIRMLILTLGHKGAWVFSDSGERHHVPAEPLSFSAETDTVGAGDAFSSVAILGILENWPLQTMLERANAFAAQICQIRGAVPSSNDFYLPFSTWQGT